MTRRTGILVVEDDPAVLRMLGLALSAHGFDVWLAASGRAAVGLYETHHDGIGLVLLDVQMDGLDGPQTLAALRGLDPNVRCCFMSGHTGRYTVEDLLRLGAAYVVEKPFPSLRRLADLLRDAAGAAEH